MSVVEVKNRPLISEQEKARRKEAIDYARGSVMLEGVVLSDEIEELNQRYINGELTSKEHSIAVDESIERKLRQQLIQLKNGLNNVR